VPVLYATFLLLFVILPALIASAVLTRAFPGFDRRAGLRAVGFTAGIAFAYTVPWDNYLVYRDVWRYGADRVVGVIGYVPVEEYLFFLLQPLFVGTVLVPLLWRAESRMPAPSRAPGQIRALGVAGFGALALVGVTLLVWRQPRGLYMGLILSWALPVLAGLWYYAGPHLWRLRRTLAAVIAGTTLWLWGADAFALRDGIWHIAEATSLGPGVAGLPVEEMTFFLVTTVLCAFSIVLFMHGDRITPPWRRG
jgi:lycopene beta-cyclase